MAASESSCETVSFWLAVVELLTTSEGARVVVLVLLSYETIEGPATRSSKLLTFSNFSFFVCSLRRLVEMVKDDLQGKVRYIKWKCYSRYIYEIGQCFLIYYLLLVVVVLILRLWTRIVWLQIVADAVQFTGITCLEGGIVLGVPLCLGQIIRLNVHNVFGYDAIGTSRWPPVNHLQGQIEMK